MPLFNNVAIMPKQGRGPAVDRSTTAAPYPTSSSNGERNAAIWSSKDDEILLRARASGLNWQPIAIRHFPNKTANACRKRHERLMDRRHVDDWGTQKFELLAQEYMACRREMWEILAERLGERWAVIEAKCMEKGLKTLQTAARTAHRKAAADQQSFEDGGISPDHHSDSGIGIGSDAEIEVGAKSSSHTKALSWHAHPEVQQSQRDHVRSRSLPQPLPLYQPPPPITQGRTLSTSMITGSHDTSFQGLSASQRCSPDSQNGRGGISIQSIVSN